MAQNKVLAELRGLLCAWLRYIETKRDSGNNDNLTRLETTDDSRLLKKWLWVVVLVSAPISFVFGPLMLGFVHRSLPVEVVKFLWMVIIAMMTVTFTLFIAAILLTIRPS